MSNKGNSGVIISGGNINVRDMAVGDNASITSSNKYEDSEKLLQEVVKLIAQMKQEGMPQDKVDAVELAKLELQKEQPNNVVVNSVLTSVADSIKNVGAISSTVATIVGLLTG